MSTGGLFNLIANDGKADRMILATELIQRRICDIQCAKKEKGMKYTQPTLAELEKTHLLFMTAHYKPYIATSFEYLRESVQSGTARWGNDVKFSIPQAGDFFHDMVVNLTTEDLEGSDGTVPEVVDGDFPATYDVDGTEYAQDSVAVDVDNVGVAEYTDGTTLTAQGDVNSRVKITKEYINAENGETLNNGVSVKGLVRWVEWPGIKALKHVEFEINSSKLDEYSSDTVLFHKTFNVHINKQEGFKKLMGQDTGYETLSNVNVSGASAYAGLSASDQQEDEYLSQSVVPASASTLCKGNIFEGNQTPAKTKPGLNLWVPLLFWFNKSVSLAIPSVSIPYGQRFVKIDLEDFQRVARPATGAIKLRTTIEQYDVVDQGTDPDTVANYNVSVHYDEAELTFAGSNNGVDSSSGVVRNVTLWVNHIYVIPQVHDIFIQRIGFNLIRLYKMQIEDLSSGNQSSGGDGNGPELNQLKFPVETLYFGFQPTANNELGEDYWKSWHSFASLDKQVITKTADVPSLSSNLNSEIAEKTRSVVQLDQINYWRETQTVDTVGLKSHGILLFKEIDQQFWNAYIPYKYGGYDVNTPKETGMYMINFAQYPGQYQPTGHFNFSRAKQTYLLYKSAFISSANNVRLILVAIAINFLVISDGSAVIRYST